MFHSITLVTALLLTWIALPASTQDGLYVEFTPGVSILADSDLSGPVLLGFSGEAEFDTGFVIGGSVGYRFLDSFRGEVNLSYRQADIAGGTIGALMLDGAGDVGLLALMGNVYYDLELELPVTPYLGVGIGVGFFDVDTGESPLHVIIVDDTATEFAWNIMVGASYSVTDNIDLSLGYRYLGITDPELDATLVGFGSSTLDIEVAVHEILFGFRYNFQERAEFKGKWDTSEKTAFPKPIPIQNVEESADEPDLVEQLAELHRMHQAGELTDEEYKRAKARLLN